MKILYLVADDWFFWSHRSKLAREMLRQGHQVYVATRSKKCAYKFKEAGFRFVPLKIYSKKSTNPFQALLSMLEIIRIYKWIRPDLAHHVAIRPVMYGSFASLFFPKIRTVNAYTGLGLFFSDISFKAKILREIVKLVLRITRPGDRGAVIFQNPDDMAELQRLRIAPIEHSFLIRGSGVDTEEYPFTPEPDKGVPVIVLASRMIWSKGIPEFVEASKILKARNIKCRFVLVGAPDFENPHGIAVSQLNKWVSSGLVEWWGHSNNMPEVYKNAHIACLPCTWREGLPKTLLEAASMGKPIVASNITGCREIVIDGFNGIMVTPGSTRELADAIEKLVVDPDLRKKMGQNGRKLVEKHFTIEHVIKETLKVYKFLLDRENIA